MGQLPLIITHVIGLFEFGAPFLTAPNLLFKTRCYHIVLLSGKPMHNNLKNTQLKTRIVRSLCLNTFYQFTRW